MLRDLVLKDLHALKVDKQLEIQAEKFINLLYDSGTLKYLPKIAYHTDAFEVVLRIYEPEDYVDIFIHIYKTSYGIQGRIPENGLYSCTMEESLFELPEIIKKYIYLQPIEENNIDLQPIEENNIDLPFDSLTDYTDAYCPHCKEVSVYDHESLPWNDDEEQELTCNMCGEEFITMVSVTYTRSSRFKDG